MKPQKLPNSQMLPEISVKSSRLEKSCPGTVCASLKWLMASAMLVYDNQSLLLERNSSISQGNGC